MGRSTVIESLLEHIVDASDDRTTVSHILRGRLKLSQRLYRRLKREDAIFVNGLPVRVDAKVNTGDMISLSIEPEGFCDTIPETLDLDIRFEDSSVVVVNKPAKVCVHPTHGHWTGTLANGLAQHYIASGVTSRVRPVHRLDMDTTGLVVFAKTQLDSQKLAEQLEDGRFRRLYVAVVRGKPEPPGAIVEGPIDRCPDNPKLRCVCETGRRAVTHYKVLQCLGSASVVELWLETGRTHQIRVHMAYIGHPLLGDAMYWPRGEGQVAGESAGELVGELAAESAGELVGELLSELASESPTHLPTEGIIARQALHAYRVEFNHPRSGVRMEFEAGLPDDMNALITSLLIERGYKGAEGV